MLMSKLRISEKKKKLRISVQKRIPWTIGDIMGADIYKT